ncbi:uncharacterized protein BJ212DRAFT_1303909 [Suillus subaureus]|uniref:Uncharacterized protein n=1 Tax=Suillus subaureus TaxID=48587 RepID=A0A9P7DXL3_9AGAM|nr:uncharacterized protein BJ212DRAFT_1303909 [Suillus subaureus]KAG1805848.1 hypothetical protein BJ212DRAFT_1303909 [Suillus subaureus]
MDIGFSPFRHSANAHLLNCDPGISPASMKLAHTKALSPEILPSHHHPERHEYNQSTNNTMRNVAKRRANRRPTTDDIKHPQTQARGPRPVDPLQVMDSPPSYPPNAIVRRMAGCTQASQGKSGPCAKPFGPSLPDLRFTGKSLARSDQSEMSLIEAQAQVFDPQVAIQGKDILQRGLQHMSDEAIQQAARAKQASRETRRLRVILTAWEIEEAERHAELLRLLQRSNVEGYEEANNEASWFERFISDRSLAQVQDDFGFNMSVYRNDLALLGTADEQLDQLESHAEERNLLLFKEDLTKDLKALMVEGGDGEGSEDDDSVYDSNTSESH